MIRIEVGIPCFNEEATIGKVVRDFRAALPDQEVVVYDNNSRDKTADEARQAGARVVRVNRQGKGFVIQAMFEQSQADVLMVVDGDDTYEASDVKALIEPILSGEADMTIGTRLHVGAKEFRAMHHFGNSMLTWILNTLYRRDHKDILSGYRGFSRRFVDAVPLISGGFEIESELLIQALEHDFAVKEMPIHYRNRPPGSESKLNSFRDGYRILLTIISLLRDHRPFLTFSTAALVIFVLGATAWTLGFLRAAGNPSLSVFRSGGVVLIMFSFGLLLIGLVLNTVNTRMREMMSLLRRKRR
jgi:glycosyltransferase involved in cell wall biosynthesis